MSELTLIGDEMAAIIERMKLEALHPSVDREKVAKGDSPLEERFWGLIKQTRVGETGGLDQFEIGRYRVDAIFACDRSAVVVELDGRTFHDYNADRLRDQEILKRVRAVIRVPSTALFKFPVATFHVMAGWFDRFTLPVRSDRVTTKEALDEMFEFARDVEPDITEASFYERIRSQYEVVSFWGDNAVSIGSPGDFSQTRVSIRWGRGNTDPLIMDRIRKKQRGRAIT